MKLDPETKLAFGITGALLVAAALLLVQMATLPAPVVVKQAQKLTLPELCAPLYNVGRSRDWQRCMGVEPK